MKPRTLALVAVFGLLASASFAQDPAAGEKIFVQCKACHQVGPGAKNLTGPNLNGLFGRKSGSVDGARYSAANKTWGQVWTEEVFRTYIQNPRETIPGTTMAFAGLRDAQKISDLIAYLKQFGADGKTP